jgi:DNA-binding SARP family transcriptional activator
MLIDTSVDEDIEVAIDRLERMASDQRASGQSHFEGITYLNLAEAFRATDRPSESAAAARLAIERLESSSTAAEIASGHALVAWALIHSEQTGSGWTELELALSEDHEAIRIDVLSEASYLEALYGDVTRALDHLAEVERSRDRFPLLSRTAVAVAAYLAIRTGDYERADRLISSQPANQPTIFMAYKSFLLCVKAHSLVSQGSPLAIGAIDEARDQSDRQSAKRWVAYCEALQAANDGASATNRFVRTRDRRGMWAVTYAAELFAARLHHLGETEFSAVLTEARIRQDRWRPALRAVIDSQGEAMLPAARLLESIGEQADVSRLMRVGRRHRGTADAEMGRRLARTVADRVFVEDLGRVRIHIGKRLVDGSSIRRKVLGLLCFMLSRARFAATRDEVMDALWPEFDPADALNSLNQTVYFLRRVFEPNYKDDLSPGYVHHESDLLWLDEELITSSSRTCGDAMKRMPRDPTPDQVSELSALYVGQFALDFAYEDWAASYRSSLHSSYLQVIERGIDLARRALDLAPDADQLELSLLRLYRLNGSHAAAAEQYGHYAATVRDNLGIEPPPFDSL